MIIPVWQARQLKFGQKGLNEVARRVDLTSNSECFTLSYLTCCLSGEAPSRQGPFASLRELKLLLLPLSHFVFSPLVFIIDLKVLEEYPTLETEWKWEFRARGFSPRLCHHHPPTTHSLSPIPGVLAAALLRPTSITVGWETVPNTFGGIRT